MESQPQYHLLLIEDDDLLVKTLRAAFAALSSGFEIVRRETFMGCAEYLRLERPLPDLVLLDLGLPDSEPFDTLNKIKILARYNVPIVIFTGKGDDIVKTTALENGAVWYFDKPMPDVQEFVEKVEDLIRLDRIKKGLTARAEEKTVLASRLITNGAANGTIDGR